MIINRLSVGKNDQILKMITIVGMQREPQFLVIN